LYFRNRGYWINNYNEELVRQVYADGTSLSTLNSVTNEALDENLRSSYYSVEEVDLMLNEVGLESQSMGFRSFRGVTEVLETMGQFNSDETMGAFGIAHFSHELNGDEGDHFAVFIPEYNDDELTVSFIDSYGPSIANMQQYAENHELAYQVHTNDMGINIGITLSLGNPQGDRLLTFLEDSNMNNIHAIPVITEDIAFGLTDNLMELNALALNK
jgi:hypothetical protein